MNECEMVGEWTGEVMACFMCKEIMQNETNLKKYIEYKYCD